MAIDETGKGLHSAERDDRHSHFLTFLNAITKQLGARSISLLMTEQSKKYGYQQ
jgi:hypothetical protein